MYDGSTFTVTLDDWDVIMDLRTKIYCEENSIPINLEFDEMSEKTSRHVICYGEFHIDCRFHNPLIFFHLPFIDIVVYSFEF